MLDPHCYAEGETPVMTPVHLTPASTPRHGGTSPADAPDEALSAYGKLKERAAATAAATAERVRAANDTVGTLTEAAKRVAASRAGEVKAATAGVVLGGFGAVSAAAGAAVRVFASGARQGAVEMGEEAFGTTVCDRGEVLEVPRRSAHTQTFQLRENSTLKWEFRVREYDLGFKLLRRTMAMGGAVEDDLVDAERFAAGVAVAGEWRADADCQVVAMFDNTYSMLRAKAVRYRFAAEKPSAAAAPSSALAAVEARHREAAAKRDAAMARVLALRNRRTATAAPGPAAAATPSSSDASSQKAKEIYDRLQRAKDERALPDAPPSPPPKSSLLVGAFED